MKTKITLLISMIITLSLSAQNIEFTFDNAQTTNDGANDFYEVDVMIATIDGQSDFKLGKGQVYINYNTAAFGTFINGSSGIEINYPEAEGYFLGQVITLPVYTTTGTGIADNSSSRISFAYQQSLSSGTMTDNITSTPTKLFHIKMQFTDAGELPMVAFEDDETQVSNCRDQFETACGPFTAGFALADCSGVNLGTVFNNANFNNGGATLSDKSFELSSGILLYPNPAREVLCTKGDLSKLKSIDIYSAIGQHVMNITKNFSEINVSKLESAMYIVKLKTNEETTTYRIVKE